MLTLQVLEPDLDRFLCSRSLSVTWTSSCVSGPDFRMLSQLSQLLQDSDLTLSPRLLQCTSPSVQQEEFQATVDALQARGRYTQARQVAELAGLPVHHLLLGQVWDTVDFRSRLLWIEVCLFFNFELCVSV